MPKDPGTLNSTSALSFLVKNLSLEAARKFSKILNVDEAFLLCESDYKSESNFRESYSHSLNQAESLCLELLNLCGYSLVCDFVGNWEDLGLDKFDQNAHSSINRSPDEIARQVIYLTEVITPNGKHFYCDSEDIELLHYELMEYMHLRMKQMESKYSRRFYDARILPRKKGSELSFYNNYPKNDFSFDSLELSAATWTNHEYLFFPDITLSDSE